MNAVASVAAAFILLMFMLPKALKRGTAFKLLADPLASARCGLPSTGWFLVRVADFGPGCAVCCADWHWVGTVTTMLLPKPSPFPPPADPVDAAAALAAVERVRADAAAAEQERAPWRRPVLEAGPRLRDIEAALGCSCGCHPQPPSPRLHEGGLACPCQLSPHERSASARAALDALRDLSADLDVGRDSREAVEGVAADLGIEVISCGGLAPFVIEAVVDGRFFYVRERHGQYRVVIAPDNDPLCNVWRDCSVSGLEVASGVAEDFDTDGEFSPALALRLATGLVRVALRRRSCAHESSPLAWFCPSCGLPLAPSGLAPVS